MRNNVKPITGQEKTAVGMMMMMEHEEGEREREGGKESVVEKVKEEDGCQTSI